MSRRRPVEPSDEFPDAAESSPPEDELSPSGPVELAAAVGETGLVEFEKPEVFASPPPHANNDARNAERNRRNTPLD